MPQLHEDVGLLAPDQTRRRGTLVPGLKYCAEAARLIEATMKASRRRSRCRKRNYMKRAKTYGHRAKSIATSAHQPRQPHREPGKDAGHLSGTSFVQDRQSYVSAA